jgi:hypothetical protein
VHDFFQTKIRGLENSLKRKLPSNFDKILQDFVNGYKPEGKGHISIEKAPFQADPCLAQLAVAGDTCIDAIISGDSDFCVYMLGRMDKVVLQISCSRIFR